MLRLTEIKLPLTHAEGEIRAAILKRLGIGDDDLVGYAVFKRGVDARKPNAILFTYTLDVELRARHGGAKPAGAGVPASHLLPQPGLTANVSEVRDEAAILAQFNNDPHIRISPDTRYHFVAHAPQNLTSRPIVIGMGPAGLFAGLLLAQMGFRPLILERGKEVRERTKDTFGLWRQGVLNPESNVQFGEGGAGTFSDGKLYSQIKDPRYLGRKVLEEFVKAGAPAEILYESHPHIGTFRLVGMVEQMRETIQALGGEIRFSSRVDDIEISNGPNDIKHVTGVKLANGEFIATRHLVLAVGHSARDTFEMVHKRGIYIEAKPFSIGFRIEHPQSLIDAARYGKNAGNPLLGAADYKLVHHAGNGRSVYSFCMCPGGTVVAATSEIGRVVTNGMSQYSRNERNANSGIVVGITPEQDYPGGPLAGMEFQRRWESHAFELGGKNYRAPGQLVGDFIAGRPSTKFGVVQPSYTPGVHLTDLSSALPDYAIAAIREALPAFARQIRGFDLADAVLTGVETRTSSPIRIKRNKDDYQSINTRGLYPSGEGAGYAGGILSAAVDGIEVAEAVALSMIRTKNQR
ncbi:MAG: FAD dependent oxidoreductase [Candidatus Gallionella acididurans]|uniref:FAD dependent oxidoreductase n=1 Tax=Candidatus Gallionella acididurans TaxID=1796491 RepID=A0A139BPZ7_9PROT|nr:MAG: FAD dependent oxidoreductase [Candidatus Gallionella acididurans]